MQSKFQKWMCIIIQLILKKCDMIGSLFLVMKLFIAIKFSVNKCLRWYPQPIWKTNLSHNNKLESQKQTWVTATNLTKHKTTKTNLSLKLQPRCNCRDQDEGDPSCYLLPLREQEISINSTVEYKLLRNKSKVSWYGAILFYRSVLWKYYAIVKQILFKH